MGRISLRNHFLPIAAFFFLGFAAYFPSLRGDFIWDDDAYVVKNQAIRSWSGVEKIWTQPGATPQYYPLTFTSLALDFSIWGLNPLGYHITNTCLHIFSAILLWVLFKQLKIPGAWFAAALFLTHPVHVESVAWITERKNVLSCFFLLAACWAYIRFLNIVSSPEGKNQKGKRGFYILSLLLFISALLSKTTAVAFPVIILGLIWWKSGRIKRDQVFFLIPFFMIGFVFAFFTTTMEQHIVGAEGSYWDLSIIDRMLIAGRALWFYLGKLLVPYPLAFNYVRWNMDATHLSYYIFPVGWGLLLLAAFVLRKKAGRGLLTGLSLFTLTLFPALGFVDVYPFRYSFVADHFQYVPSIFVILLIASSMTKWLQNHSTHSKRLEWVAKSGLIGVLCLLTWKQSHAYKDLHTLWTDTIRKNPGSILANHNMGVMWMNQGQYGEAVPFLKRSTESDPINFESFSKLGISLVRSGQMASALPALHRALELNPFAYDVYAFIGEATILMGHYDSAEKNLAKALEINPNYGYAHLLLGEVGLMKGQFRVAEHHFQQAIQLWPRFPENYVYYGRALLRSGQSVKARENLETALQLSPTEPKTLVDLAQAFELLGDFSTSQSLLVQAEAIAPKNPWVIKAKSQSTPTPRH